jgi:flagellar hook-associated protein 2
MSGLISGLDTESLVKAMAANTKTKIDSKKQKLQTLQWKQEAYRSTISDVTSFQSKYLSISGSTSIKANAIMNKYKADSSDSRVTASATSTALAATYSIKSATAATTATLTSAGAGTIDTVALDFSNNVEGKDYTLNMTLDGTKLSVNFTGGANEEESKANFLNALNDTFKDYRTDAQGFEFKDGTTDLVFNGNNDGICHTFTVGYNSEAVGLKNNTSNMMDTNTTLGEIAFANELVADDDGNYTMNINGVDFSFTKDTSISSMVSTINNSDAGVKMVFSSVSQSFTLTAKDTGTAGSIKITQENGGNLANALFNTTDDLSQAVYGKNGTITISSDGVNYKTYTSASNSYTFDGTTINIGKIGDFDSEADGVDEITVETAKDNSSIKDVVVNFVNDYNTLLASLYKTINTSRPKSSGSYYDPLTDDQEDEMTSEEIDDWNEKAKTGLLYQDTNISKLISDMRSAMSSAFDGYTLAAMGITVSSDLNDNGTLLIDEDALDAALDSYGDKITSFFTDSEGGLATKLNSALDKAVANSSTTGYGYLTSLAGIENTTSEKKSSLYSQINNLQSIIDTLEDRYEDELERYWSKFTTLETYMSNMQSQSSVFDSSY